MGNEGSRIDADKMPKYFVEDPQPTPTSVYILDQSMNNILHGPTTSETLKPKNRVRVNRLPFTQFYTTFYDRLSTEKDGLCEYLSHDLENQSVFLVEILKFIKEAPKHTLLSRRHGKWPREAVHALKAFLRRYPGMEIRFLGPIGEALFLAARDCDEMFTSIPHKYWREAYSLFLIQIVPMMLKKKSRRQRTRIKFDELGEMGSTEEESPFSSPPDSGSVTPSTDVTPCHTPSRESSPLSDVVRVKSDPLDEMHRCSLAQASKRISDGRGKRNSLVMVYQVEKDDSKDVKPTRTRDEDDLNLCHSGSVIVNHRRKRSKSTDFSFDVENSVKTHEFLDAVLTNKSTTNTSSKRLSIIEITEKPRSTSNPDRSVQYDVLIVQNDSPITQLSQIDYRRKYTV